MRSRAFYRESSLFRIRNCDPSCQITTPHTCAPIDSSDNDPHTYAQSHPDAGVALFLKGYQNRQGP
jgi:hypothetical protein